MLRHTPRYTLFPYTTLFRSMQMKNLTTDYKTLLNALEKIASIAPAWEYEDGISRSEEHTSELQSLRHLVCRLLLEKKKHSIAERSVDPYRSDVAMTLRSLCA